MLHNESGNASTSQNPDVQGQTRRDWREERRKWREERREARHRLPFHGLFWGLTLILLGALFLLNQAGRLTGDTWWQSLLVGLGVIFMINGVAYFQNPGYRWASWGRFMFGIVLILIGALFLLGFSQWWPLVLIVAGIALLVRPFWFRK